MKAVSLVLIILLIALLGGSAEAATPQVTMADASGTQGSTITVPVTVSGASGLGSMDLIITYDPAVLTVASVDKGTLNKGMLSTNTSAPGLIALSLVDPAGMSGSGDVAMITFNVIGNASQASPLTVQTVQAYDAGTFLDTPVTISSGSFTVRENPAAGGGKSGSENALIFILIGIIATMYLIGRNKR